MTQPWQHETDLLGGTSLLASLLPAWRGSLLAVAVRALSTGNTFGAAKVRGGAVVSSSELVLSKKSSKSLSSSPKAMSG